MVIIFSVKIRAEGYEVRLMVSRGEVENGARMGKFSDKAEKILVMDHDVSRIRVMMFWM